MPKLEIQGKEGTSEVCKALGCSRQWAMVFARLNGVERVCHMYFWTDAEIEAFKEFLNKGVNK